MHSRQELIAIITMQKHMKLVAFGDCEAVTQTACKYNIMQPEWAHSYELLCVAGVQDRVQTI